MLYCGSDIVLNCYVEPMFFSSSIFQHWFAVPYVCRLKRVEGVATRPQDDRSVLRAIGQNKTGQFIVRVPQVEVFLGWSFKAEAWRNVQ